MGKHNEHPYNVTAEETAIKMFLRGATYSAIGRELGVSRQRAYQIIKRARERGRYGFSR